MVHITLKTTLLLYKVEQVPDHGGIKAAHNLVFGKLHLQFIHLHQQSLT